MHDETLYKCTEEGCDKSYNRKDNLNQHLKKVHNTSVVKRGRFQCHVEDCPDCYFHRSNLINHLKSKHGICVGRLLSS